MSQQEDDLRALAKIMDFLRAVSIILVVMNVYWFCYEAIRLWGVNIGVVDKILLNFDRTAVLSHSILYTTLFSVLLLALSCLGTKGVKGEKITWGRIWTAFAVGFVLFFLNWWLLPLPLPLEAVTGLYVLSPCHTPDNRRYRYPSLWMLRTRHTGRPPTTVKIYRAVWACSLPKVRR